jgi:hypothetical protein
MQPPAVWSKGMCHSSPHTSMALLSLVLPGRFRVSLFIVLEEVGFQCSSAPSIRRVCPRLAV